ncbi:tetratricopeptide repeat protein [Trichodesmium erythraeum 21-75]|nr:tetratricopeptide repeat protein [Trichodesmium erythraeum 21-75]
MYSYQKAIEINPNNYWFYYSLGKALCKLSRYEEAITAYQRGIKIDPNLYFAYHNLGVALVELKRWNQAIVAYRQAIKIKPDSYWSHYNLGEIFLKLQEWDKAVETYRYAIENNPNSPWYYQYLGIVLRKQGKIQEAIACYRKAIEIKPDWHRFYSLLGDILLEIGDSEEAISCYIKAIKLQPNATAAYRQLRGIYIFKLAQLRPHQLNELVKCYQEAIKLQPNFPEVYINLADILTGKGELDTAINYYQKATYNKLLVSHPEFVKNHWDFQEFGQPSFVIIGTVKGGTSSLYNYLCHHPNVIPALQKEINFFNNKFNQGIDWYLAHFPQLPEQGKFITGEATPNYMYSDEIGKKLLDNFPKIKIIAILRNPVDRTISHYYMAKRLGQESKKFTEFVPQEMKFLRRLNNNYQNYQRLIKEMSAYFRGSLYIHFLKKWINLFPKEQLLILKSEDMYENPAGTTKKAFDFLGLPNYQLLEYKKYFPGYYAPIDASLRCQIAELFQPHNQKLEESLGIKFNWD